MVDVASTLKILCTKHLGQVEYLCRMMILPFHSVISITDYYLVVPPGCVQMCKLLFCTDFVIQAVLLCTLLAAEDRSSIRVAAAAAATTTPEGPPFCCDWTPPPVEPPLLLPADPVLNLFAGQPYLLLLRCLSMSHLRLKAFPQDGHR